MHCSGIGCVFAPQLADRLKNAFLRFLDEFGHVFVEGQTNRLNRGSSATRQRDDNGPFVRDTTAHCDSLPIRRDYDIPIKSETATHNRSENSRRPGREFDNIAIRLDDIVRNLARRAKPSLFAHMTNFTMHWNQGLRTQPRVERFQLRPAGMA